MGTMHRLIIFLQADHTTDHQNAVQTPAESKLDAHRRPLLHYLLPSETVVALHLQLEPDPTTCCTPAIYHYPLSVCPPGQSALILSRWLAVVCYKCLLCIHTRVSKGQLLGYLALTICARINTLDAHVVMLCCIDGCTTAEQRRPECIKWLYSSAIIGLL